MGRVTYELHWECWSTYVLAHECYTTYTSAHSCCTTYTSTHSCCITYTSTHSCCITYTSTHSCCITYTSAHECCITYTSTHECYTTYTSTHSCCTTFHIPYRFPITFQWRNDGSNCDTTTPVKLPSILKKAEQPLQQDIDRIDRVETRNKVRKDRRNQHLQRARPETLGICHEQLVGPLVLFRQHHQPHSLMFVSRISKHGRSRSGNEPSSVSTIVIATA